MRVCLDPALDHTHSLTAGKCPAEDHEVSQAVVDRAEKILVSEGFSVFLTKTSRYVSELGKAAEAARRIGVANENAADIFVSVESSSQTDDQGFEVLYYHGSEKSKKLAESILEWVCPAVEALGIQWVGKGIRSCDMKILRETAMPAAIVRLGNCTTRPDAEAMDETFEERAAEALALAISDFRGDEKKKKEEFIVATTSAPVNILGRPVLTAEQLDQFVRKVNPKAPSVAKFFVEHGKRLGIRGDIAFCQSLHETNWFRYGGSVKASQNNYSGIGAVDSKTGGAVFKTPEEGVLAQLHHLWAYATTKDLPEQPLSPRFKYVKRGSAPTWIGLGGKWAVPGFPPKFKTFDAALAAKQTYGQLILDLYEQASKIPAPAQPKPQPAPKPEPGPAPAQSDTRTAKVTSIMTSVDGHDLNSVVIDNLGYVRVTEIAALMGKKAVLDKKQNKIVFMER